jgi:hypothetical protein
MADRKKEHPLSPNIIATTRPHEIRQYPLSISAKPHVTFTYITGGMAQTP